jgi:hypothetical protein
VKPEEKRESPPCRFGVPHPLPIFWKNIKLKELREGVCEEYADKGLMAGQKKAKEVEDPREVKDRGDLTFITGSPA